MAVDYREQYRPDQLEPFWPNEFIKMSVAVLCTLAVIMFFVILPVALDALGLHGLLHEEEPADPAGATPLGIKPEWYFLASYEFLRLMPTEVLGISGKTLGVLSQGLAMAVIAMVPFWYRRRASRRPRWAYRIVVTAALGGLLVLTLKGAWPETHGGGEPRPVPFAEFVRHRPLLFVVIGVGLLVFYALVTKEVRTIRRTLGDRPPPAPDDGEASR